MARIWVDDLDDSTPAVCTVRIEHGGSFYELDLGEANLKEYEDALLPYLAVARKIDPATVNAPPVPAYTPVTGQFKAIAAAATAPPAPAAAAALPAAVPATPAPAAISPAPASVVQEAPVREPEPVEAPDPPQLRLEPEPKWERTPDPAPFASLEFEPEPEPTLVSVGSSTNGHHGAHRVRIARPKVDSSANKDLPPVPPLDERTRTLIRDWQSNHPVYSSRPVNGRMAKDIYWGWVEDMTKGDQ